MSILNIDRPVPRVDRKRKGTLYFRAFPNDLKFLFKAWCARRGKSMKSVIEELMTDCVKSDDKQAAKKLKKQREQ